MSMNQAIRKAFREVLYKYENQQGEFEEGLPGQ